MQAPPPSDFVVQVTAKQFNWQVTYPGPDGKFGTADAWQDLLDLITEHWTPTKLGGIMHCFSGGILEAERSLAANFHLSFAGNLTYPKSQSIREAAELAPTDRIFVETDAPFLSPQVMRGKPNQPAYVVHTAKALAVERRVSLDEFDEAIAQSAAGVFRW